MTNKDIYINAGSLVILSGLPGSGKSTLKASAEGFRDLDSAWLSMDAIRRQVLGPVMDLTESGELFEDLPQSANNEVYAILTQLVKARLSHGRTCIIDATCLTDADRKPYVDMARAHGVPYKVLILNTALEDCLDANQKRATKVAEFRIREMNQPPAAEPIVTAKGKVLVQTPPQGFMRTSDYPFELVNRGDRLVQRLPSLVGEDYDVVGDLHGLYNEFIALVTKKGYVLKDGRLSHPQGRKLLLLGDLVDRGYDSIGVLRLVRNAVLDGVAVCLKGNHDEKLVRFIDTARREGIERWTSLANAETGMQLLKVDDCDTLLEFLRNLPPYQVLRAGEGLNLAFVHGDMKRFDAELTASGDMVYGQSGFRRGVDSDALYEERMARGLNEWVLFRGHIPQTSPQENVFSLERHPFQMGELVLLPLDQFLDKVRAGQSKLDAFASSVQTQACNFDFEAVSRKWDLLKGMEGLVTQKLASRQLDPSQMFRVYKYSKSTFWDNRWGDSPWLTKARGLVLDAAGNIVSHSFDKCFNYHENGTGDDLADDLPVLAVDKLNGFLGIVSSHPLKKSELLAHTQGGFSGDFTGYIRTYLDMQPTRGKVGRFLSKNDVTLLFEVLHPEDPHIIAYAPEMMGLHLLGIRGKNQGDQPWTEAAVDAAALEMELRRPSWERITFGELKKKIRSARTEGWMVRRDDEVQETLLKIKTPYYLTTKFLGRLSQKRIAHLYGSAKDFKKTVDEEFYPLVDMLIEAVDKDTFLAMNDEARVILVRDLINKML